MQGIVSELLKVLLNSNSIGIYVKFIYIISFLLKHLIYPNTF